MVPLGIGVGMGAPTWGNYMITIEDKYWNINTSTTIKPIPQGQAISRVHDTWDLDDNNDYMPRVASEISDEGFWDIVTVTVSEEEVKQVAPIDTASFDAA